MPMQAGINLRLKASLGDPVLAALVSFALGTACLGIYTLVMRVPIPTAAMMGAAPWWAWTGGLLGAFIVFSSIVLAAQLGAGATMAWLIASQLLTAMILDHYGVVGFAVREISWQRIAGVVLLIVSAVLVHRY